MSTFRLNRVGVGVRAGVGACRAEARQTRTGGRRRAGRRGGGGQGAGIASHERTIALRRLGTRHMLDLTSLLKASTLSRRVDRGLRSPACRVKG